MKKYLISLVAIAAMLLSSACSKEETPYIAENGDMVTFNIAAPEMGTRASYSDGMTATDLTVAVYQGGTYRKSLTQTATLQGGVTTVSLPLVTGVTYDIVFWAQADDAPYSFDANSGKVSVNYTNVEANNENLDAFYANKLGYTVEGAKSETIYLTRPFAQLNVATLDYALAAGSGIEITQTAIEVEGVYTSFNLLDKDGKVEGNTTTITLSKASTPSAEKQKLTGYEEYTWLSMNYLLVDAKTTVRAKMETNESAVTREWFNIPVQRNYRTNILGNILTTTTDFKVIIDEEFNKPDSDQDKWDGISLIKPHFENDTYYIAHASHLAWLSALVNGTLPLELKSGEFAPAESIDGKKIVLQCDVDFNNKPFTPISSARNITFEGQGNTIRNIAYTLGQSGGGDGGYATMFELVSGTFRNLNIENVQAIDPQTNRASAFLGYFIEGTVENVHVKNVEIKGFQKLAGIISMITLDTNKDVTLRNCSVDGISFEKSDKGDVYQAGGIVGYIASGINSGTEAKIVFENCSVEGDVVINDTPVLTSDDSGFFSNPFVGSIGSSATKGAVAEIHFNSCSVDNLTLSATPALSISPRGSEFFGDCIGEGSQFGGRIPNVIYIDGELFKSLTPVVDGEGNVVNGIAQDAEDNYRVSSEEGFSWLIENLGGDNSDDVVIVLDRDIDLSKVVKIGNSTPPVGSTGERDGSGKLIVEPFKGTFDGNGKTISNLYQSGWDMGYEWGMYGSIGLFSELENATVKNLIIDGFEAQVEGGDISFIAGSATGDCVFENIVIKNSRIGTYNNGIGSIIGWSGAGTYTFKNIKIEEDVVIGGLWGSFDSSIGGIVGQAEPGATYNFENVEINCRIDAYNDCTASYDYYNYRMCGMIIGRCEATTTIDGTNYPDLSQYYMSFNNVTVNYGTWMNYHYCEPTPGHNNGRGMRIEPGYTYGGLPADFDHSQCVDNHYNCIPFDQLIGGDQLGVKGLREVEGVTVTYPAEYTCPLCGEQHNVQQ